MVAKTEAVSAVAAAVALFGTASWTARSFTISGEPRRHSQQVALGAEPAGLALSPIPSATPASTSTAAWGLPALGITAALALRAAFPRRNRRQSRSASVALQATRSDWYRRVKRIGADQAIFDVTIKKPLGVKMEAFLGRANRDGCGISQVVEGGNADEVNKKVCIDDGPGMWVLEGDAILAIDGKDTEEATIEDLIELITTNGKDEVTMTLGRNTRKGPIKVVMMPQGAMMTVRRGSKLSAAAEYAAGKELPYGCIDGWCGTCWHRERVTNGVFKPCCDVLTADWDNVMPLVLTPKPEKAGDASFMKPRGM